ncbi:unnamed protein product, partial [marine sediment metagenome]
KVEDQVYQELDVIRVKGQTFSQVIEDMLKARLKIFELLGVLEGSLKYREWEREQLAILQKQ